MAYSYDTHQQQYRHSMTQSPNSAPVYTPLTTHPSTYDDNTTLPYGAAPATGGGAAPPPPPTSDDGQYAIRPSSYFSNPHGNNNNNNHNNTYAASGSAIHLASPPRSAASSYHNSVNGNGNNGGGGGGGGTGGTGGTGSGHATYGTNSNNYRYSSSTPYTKVPLSSPGLSSSSAPTSDPISPHSAVPLLLNNGGHPSPGLSPPMGGGGGGFYSPPPPFTTSLSSPSLQKTQQAALAGAGGGGGGLLSGGGSNVIPVTSSNTSATAHGVSSSASHGLAGGFPGIHGKRKMEQRRYSSFKHSNLDYKNDETLRKAYLSRTEHFISIWLPFLGFCAILGGMWGITIATQVQKDHMIEINSESFYNFGVDEPTLLVAAYTFISSILNGILLWCFGCAVLSYARYRLSLGRPISLRGLSALSSAKDGQFTFNHPISSKWMWLCAVCWGCFLTSTTGFNTVLLPTRRTYNQSISTTELDMTSPSFASFYNANTAGGTGGGSYYDCARWAQVRGLMVSPCPAGTAFTATTYAGRSHFESRELGELTYIRLGAITYTGTTWGTLPFTSFSGENAFTSAGPSVRAPSGRQNYSIALDSQGLRANISCIDATTSPLSMAENTTGSPLACNPATPTNTIAPPLRMRAGYCNSTSATASSGGIPSYDFYMRFTGAYIHNETDGTGHNENITCTITPFATVERTDFKSFDNSTWVTKVAALTPVQGMYPQALVERVLSTLVDMMVIFGQNSVDNLIAEQFVQITTSYFNGSYTSWPLVAQRQLEGMFAFLASYERILAEAATDRNPEVARVTRTGKLSHDTFAYAVDYPTYLLLIPITIACLLGMWFLIKSASFRHVPKFDPLCITSLVTAASTTSHSLCLDDAAIKGAAPDDEGANDAHVAFTRDEQTGQFGLERL